MHFIVYSYIGIAHISYLNLCWCSATCSELSFSFSLCSSVLQGHVLSFANQLQNLAAWVEACLLDFSQMQISSNGPSNPKLERANMLNVIWFVVSVKLWRSSSRQAVGGRGRPARRLYHITLPASNLKDSKQAHTLLLLKKCKVTAVNNGIY